MLLEFGLHCQLGDALLKPPLKIVKLKDPLLKGFCKSALSFGHALGLLDPGVERFLGRHKENAVSSLAWIHHAQLIHQEAGAVLYVLPLHLPHVLGL